MTRSIAIVIFTATLLFGLAGICPAENWPGFRGPTGLGYTQETNLPLEWGGPENKNVLWSAPLIGDGHASPVVWGDRVFVCTALWPANMSDRAKVIPQQHVLCYSTKNGSLLWDTQVPSGPWLRTDFRSGPGGGYAGPTPATDGKLLYCAFGSSVIAALDFQGKIVWRKVITPYTFDVTIGGSPVLFGNSVILFCPMAKAQDSRVVAWDKQTGQTLWEHPMPGTLFGHSTPIIIQVNDRPQMLVLASGIKQSTDALTALDPVDGHRLWWCRGAGDAASPAFGNGIVYFDCGRGGPGIAVDPTGAGDVSKTHIKWTIRQIPEGIGSPIIVGKYVYRLHVPEILRCWEADSGKLVYAKRLEGITTTWASPIADPQGHLFFASAGKSFVIQAGPEFKILSVNDLGDANHPSAAASEGRLYLVGAKKVWCIGKSQK